MANRAYYVATHADVDTGGPEALVQLAIALSSRGAAVRLFPVHISTRLLSDYPQIANIPHATPRDYRNETVILPEIDEVKSRLYTRARTYCYYLSTSYDHSRRVATCRPIAHNLKIASMLRTPCVVRPYITPSIVAHCRSLRSRPPSSRSLVLIDNDNPWYIQDSLISPWWHFWTWFTKGTSSRKSTPEALVVKGFTHAQVLELFARATAVIDWSFVGSERMPIEAVLCGARLFTSNTSSNCATGPDFALDRRSYVTPEDIANGSYLARWPDMAAMIARFESLGPSTVADDAAACGLV